jgi:hypothetical protein
MPLARRGFLKSVAVVPLAPTALAPQAASVPPSAPTGHEAVAEALAEVVKREFGEHVDAEELEAVKTRLARRLDGAARLREAARLANADEPACRFEAHPPGAPATGGRR